MSGGENLYNLWTESMDVCDECEVDAWEDLARGERDAWERTAELFENQLRERAQ